MQREEPVQPPLELTSKSYTLGKIRDREVLVIYDSETDKTTVVAPESKWYAQAMGALAVLQAVSTPLPKSLRNPKTVIHARKPKLILPGTDARN